MSIFNLKTTNEQLTSSNQGLTDYRYQELQSLQNSSGRDFAKGELVYRWQFSNSTWWIPNKSYMRARIRLNILPAGESKKIGLSMNAGNCLFSNMQYKIADQTVSQINDNFSPTATLKTRMLKSGGWLNTYGQSTNMWGASVADNIEKLQDEDDKIGDQLLPSGGNIPQKIIADTVNNGNAVVTSEVNVAQLNPGTSTNQIRFSCVDITDWGATPDTFEVGNYYQFEDKVSTFILECINIDGSNIDFRMYDGVFTEIDFDNPTQLQLVRFIKLQKGESLSRTNATKTFDLTFRPPLSVFDLTHAIPCASSKHELTMTPYSTGVWEKRIVENLSSSALTLGVDYEIEIVDLKLYLLTCLSNPIADNFQFFLDLQEVQCTRTTITADTEQKAIDIKESTHAISLAFQDEGVDNEGIISPTRFKIKGDVEQRLERYWLRYAGMQVPQPDFEGINNTNENGDTDTTSSIYVRTMMYSNLVFKDTTETEDEFRLRGFYIHHPFPKTATDRSTRVYIQTRFRNGTIGNGGNLIQPFMLLFSHYKKVVICNVENGKITRITPIDA